MRYVQLRAFHSVAVQGGFSRAAAVLNLTQPAISDQVRRLEEEYDILLFNRSKRQVTLTPAGEGLLEITNGLFEHETQAREYLAESGALNSGELRIIADAAHHITPTLSRFRSKYPGVHISMRGGNSQRVISELESYNADVGVLGEIPRGDDLKIVRLGSTPLIAFAGKGSLYELDHEPTYAELAELPLVFREPGSKTRQKLVDAAARAGVTLAPAIEAEGREAVREIVATGAGIGFVSLAEYGRDERLVPIRLADPGLTMDEALICLRNRSNGKLIKAFMGLAAEYLVEADRAT